jgi:hypothetical protein
VARSETLAAIWRGVYGADYPQDASPFSFVTVPELQWLAGAMNVTDGRSSRISPVVKEARVSSWRDRPEPG